MKAITNIIANSIKVNPEKDTVLIIDDVDRIDPEHLFRILNVFAAHFDFGSKEKNKFNFDKILLVCDFHNIRNAFHHRYGNDVDFRGYINKFFSSEIYHFDNKKAVIEILSNIANSFDFSGKTPQEKMGMGRLYFANQFLIELLSILIRNNFISLRDIMHVSGKLIGYEKSKLSFGKDWGTITAVKSPMLIQLRLLQDFVGDYHNLKSILLEFQKGKERLEDLEDFFGDFIAIIKVKEHEFKRERVYKVEYMGNELVLQNRLGHDPSIELVKVFQFEGKDETGRMKTNSQFTVTPKMFWQAFIEAVDLLHDIGYLR